MARVTLKLPLVLEPIAGSDQLQVEGDGVWEALESAFSKVAVLRHHMLLDTGELRPHILCIVNGENVPREELSSVVLADGDEILIHQAISGG